jgi:predicted membrane protein
MITNTRLTIVIFGLILGLIEGILRALLGAFPVIEVLGFQGTIIGAYLAVKTYNNTKEIRANGNGGTKP